MFPSSGRQLQGTLNDVPSHLSTTPVHKESLVSKDATKQKRRISMSNAQPGDETSTQTMESLNFDESDDDGEADDSREYVSAEEGFEDDNDDAISTAEQIDETTSNAQPVPLVSRDSVPVQSVRPPMIQRKRSSTTTGVPPHHEVTTRPSPLDGWHFDFSSRQPPRDLPSETPTSTAFGHSDKSAYRLFSNAHSRQTSRDSDTLTFRSGQRTVTPSRAFSSPLASVQPAFGSLQNMPSNESPAEAPNSGGSQASNSQANVPGSHSISSQNLPFSDHEGSYQVITRSARVLDEEANVIEYANARVMSGGVKIGDVLPRGSGGAILEEEEDEEGVTFESMPPSHGRSTAPDKAAHPTQHPSYASLSTIVPATTSAGASPQGASIPLANVPTTQVPSAPIQKSFSQSSLVPGSPKAISQPPPLTIPVTLNAPPMAQKLSHPVHLTGINPGIKGPTSTVSPSPVTSHPSNQFSNAPVEYCGDFRTTGYCRFGARCRYSHDIKPRVKNTTAGNKNYRQAPSLLSSPQRRDPLPQVPPGYNLSNVLPQPHHVPGVPLAQQLPSPFVFAPASSIAHPATSPAATAAAQQGYLMANPEQAAKILKSHGLTTQQFASHQPAPNIQADGEIMYDLTKGRSTETRELFTPTSSRSTGKLSGSTTTPADLEKGRREAREMLAARFGSSAEIVTPESSEAATTEAEGDDDIWTVSTGRQHHDKNVTNSSGENTQQTLSGDKTMNPRYEVDQYARTYPSVQPPPSYSPVQHLQYARAHPHPSTGAFMVPHYPQMTTQPMAVSTQVPGGPVPVFQNPGTPLTQEDVIKMFASLGVNMVPPPGRVPHVSPPGVGYPAFANPQAQVISAPLPNPQNYPQNSRHPSAPYDVSALETSITIINHHIQYMYPSMPH
jgi:hypothetical protein